MTEKSESEIVVTCGANKAVIHAVPFKIDFYNDGVLSVSVNAKGLFHFEHLRKKPINEYGYLKICSVHRIFGNVLQHY